MARRGKPTIRITADADGVKRGTREAETHLTRLEKSGTKSLNRLKGASVAAGAGLLTGAVVGLKASADAAIEAEKTQGRLEAQLKASGTTWAAHRDEIDRVIGAHSRLSGLDDEDLTDAFTNIVRITGDVDKSLRLTGIAADFARAKHMDVAKAGEIVGKVAGGNTGILSRYGIQIDKGATASEALAALQKKFAGQAEAYGKTTAGSLDRMNVGAENLGEVVGEKLSPYLAEAADGLSKFIGEMETGEGAGGRFADKAEKVADVVGDIAKFLKDHPKLVAVAVGAWGTYKLASIAAMTAVKVQTFRKAFAKSVPVAAEQGAAAGAAYAGAFDAAAATGVAKAGRGGKFLTAVKGLAAVSGIAAGAIVADEILKAISGEDVDAADITRPESQGGQGGAFAGKTPGGFPTTPAGQQQKERRDRAQPGKGTPDRLKTKKLPGGFPKKRTVKAVGSSLRGPMGGRGGSGGLARVATIPRSPGGGSPAASVPPLAAFLSSEFGLDYSSGYRTPEHNRAVGGVDGSWHTRGSASRPGAIDMVGSVAAMQAALEWARENVSGLAEAMIHDAGSGLHLHLAGTGVMNWTANSSTRSSTRRTGASRAALPAGTPYASEITAAAREYGISPALLAGLIKQESGFNPNIVSKAGAVGLTQLMPGTARGLGVTDPTNPRQSIRGGAKYLKQQLDRFGGNVSLALAAYNAGPNAVQKYGGIPPYAETQNYVKAVTGFAQDFGGGQSAAASFEKWRMTPARRFALRLARAESADALAGTTPGSTDDLRAQRRLERVKLDRIKRIDRTLRGRLNPDKRAELINERAQLVGEIFGHRDTRADLRLRSPAYEQSLARIDVDTAMAEQTPGNQDDLQAWYAEATAKESRLTQVKRALRRNLSPGKRQELLGEQASLIRELGGLRTRYDELKHPDAGDAPTKYDYLESRLAQAQLAGDTGGQLGILRERQGALRGDLAGALATADPRDEIPIISALQETTDAIKSLEGSMDDNKAALLELTKAENERLKRELAVSQAQYGVADRVGQQVGLALQTPSAPGRFSSTGAL